MKKYLSLAAGATMLLGTAVGIALPATAHAQAATTGAASGPFADVPADHWAYTAVNTLQKAGIVIGYPDGTYGGRRAMTRYEFAVAIARLLPQINKHRHQPVRQDGRLPGVSKRCQRPPSAAAGCPRRPPRLG